MTGPRLGQGMPTNDSWITRELADLQRQITELRAARTLEAATIGAGGLTVAGGAIKSANFNGNVDADTAGTTGWGLGGPNGNAVFNNITLRGGIIGNDALSSPVDCDRFDGGVGGLTLTPTQSTRFSGSIAVPAGFSQALVICIATIGGQNNSGVFDGLRCSAVIQGVAGSAVVEGVDSVNTSHSISVFTSNVAGLSGGSISVDAFGGTTSQTWTSATARVSAIAVFLR